MPNKKARKKHTKLKKTAAKKAASAKKTIKKKPARKAASTKRPPKRRLPPKRAAAKTSSIEKKSVKKSSVGKTTAAAKTSTVIKKRAPRESQTFDNDATALQERRSGSAGQSGDLQGLSGHEGADSESVDELLEEGNAFEADVVSGVESADDADEQEVHTHEVSEDDVPGEYLDKD
jgi:hypothetical protein